LPRLSPQPVPVCDSCHQSLTGNVSCFIWATINICLLQTVQPLEKSRSDPTEKDGNWWGSGKPPPSFRNLYPANSKILKGKGEDKRKLTDAEQGNVFFHDC
jgi:hypothetical protein